MTTEFEVKNAKTVDAQDFRLDLHALPLSLLSPEGPREREPRCDIQCTPLAFVNGTESDEVKKLSVGDYVKAFPSRSFVFQSV